MSASQRPSYAALAEALENLYCAAKSGQNISLHPSLEHAKQHLDALYGGSDASAEVARASVEEGLAHLRSLLVDPVAIQYSTQISLEVRPLDDDERILVYRKNWGCTQVNYTDEGVILDVFSAAEEQLEAIHTACVYREDLEAAAATDMPSPM